MNRTHPLARARFDQDLVEGQEVEARFTSGGRCLAFRGRIVKLNAKTARVESIQDATVNGWGKGHVFVIQRHESPTSSANNCLLPVEAP